MATKRVLLAVLVASAAWAANQQPPPVVGDLAKALDGATRTADGKTCIFSSPVGACAMEVKVSCTRGPLTYAYTMVIPLSAVDLKRSSVVVDAGGFTGSHGVTLTTEGAAIITTTDDGAKTTGNEAVLAFGTTAKDLALARKVLGLLSSAKKACK